MKLYLSSFRLGDRLVALLPPNARVAVICKSIDTEDPDVLRAKSRISRCGTARPSSSTATIANSSERPRPRAGLKRLDPA
jgi:hypothetical protein